MGLTQKELARKIKGSQEDISRYETGRGIPLRKRREKIAKILDRSVKTLFPVKKKN